MYLSPLFRSSLLVVPLLLFMAACDTVGDAPVIDSAATSADAPFSSSNFTIDVIPSSPQAGESVSLTLDVPSDYDRDGSILVWMLETGESLGTGLSVEHVFDAAGEYGFSVIGLPDTVSVEGMVSVVGEQ